MADKIEMEPGVYTDIDFLDYVKINALNHSTLKKFSENSPAHFKYKQDNDIEKETDALSEGRIYHLAVLEPGTYEEKVIHTPKDWRQYEAIFDSKQTKKLEENPKRIFDGRTKEARMINEAFEHKVKELKKDKPDLQVVDYLIYWKAEQIRNALLSNATCKKIISNSVKEVTIVWIDEETGIKCKGRLDCDNEDSGYFADLKKTRDAHPYRFARDFRKHNYYSQFAFYSDGCKTLGHKDLKATIVMAVEDYEPFYVQPFYVKMESSWMSEGRSWYRKQIERYAYCLETNEWHGYYDDMNDSFKMYELPELFKY